MKTFAKQIQSVTTGMAFLLLLCLLQPGSVRAQNVGIGAASFTPDAQSMLDVQSTSKGILIPRMTDAQRIAISPTAGSDYGLMVYQTNTVSATNAAGYWYWNGTSWTNISSGNNWSVTGNTGTSATSNFVGTTDANDFVIRTNNTERARVTSAGNTGIGITSPSVKFQVDGGSSSSLSTGGYLMLGNTSTYNLVMDRDDIMARNNGSASDLSLNNSGGHVLVSGASSAGCLGIGTTTPTARLEVQNSSTSRGAYIHNSSSTNSANALKVEHDGTGNGIYCTAAGTSTTGIYCAQGGVSPWSSTTIVSTGGWNVSINTSLGKGISSGGTDIGVEGYAEDDGNTSTDQLGGVFYVKNPANSTTTFATVGSIVDNISYKIVGTGLVSTIVNDLEEKPVVMAAPEAPEALFQDFGTGQLVNGKAHIDLDPILSKNIKVDEQHPVKIFIQLNDECNGVFVKNKDGFGFDVAELGNGTSNARFSWMLTATRKNETRNGQTSDYEGFRFKRTNQPGFYTSEKEATDKESIKK